jgi:ankyrin repeat protein
MADAGGGLPGLFRRLRKSAYYILLLTGLSTRVRAADPLEDALAKGLLAEEAQHDLKAAVAAYGEAVRLADQQRPTVATALFRLAESQRRLGLTNESTANYLRVIRECPSQTNLVELALKHLPNGAGIAASEGATSSGASAAMTDLQAKIHLNEATLEKLKKLPPDGLPSAMSALYPTGEVNRLLSALNDANQQLAARRTEFGPGNPEIKQIAARIKEIQVQLDQQAKDMMNGLQLALDAQKSAAMQLQKVYSESNLTPGESASSPGVDDETREIDRLRKMLVDSPDLIDRYDAQGGGNRPLINAATKDKAKVLDFLLAQGADVNGLNAGGKTPLYAAAEAGHKRMVERLLKAGADVNKGTSGGVTPLHAAVTAGHRQVTQTLISAGASVSATATVSIAGSAFHGITPLGVAIENGDVGTVELLIKAGADPNARAQEEGPQEPILIATTKHDWATAEALLKLGAKPDLARKDASVLISPGAAPPSRLAELFLKAGVDINEGINGGWTPLHHAAANGWEEYARWLLAHGANPNATARTGQTPLDAALQPTVNASISPSRLHDQLTVVDALIEAKADVNKLNGSGDSPLWVAWKSRSKDAAAKLLAAGANPNQRNSDGYSLLFFNTAMWPKEVDEVYPEFARLLVKYGADPNADGPNGAPLSAAVEKGPDCVKTLLSLGANPNLAAPHGQTPLELVRGHLSPIRGRPGSPNNLPMPVYREIERALLDAGARESDAVEKPEKPAAGIK